MPRCCLSRERSSVRVSSSYIHTTRSCSIPRSNDADQATQPRQNASRSGCFGGLCHSIPNRTVFVKSLSPDHGKGPLSLSPSLSPAVRPSESLPTQRGIVEGEGRTSPGMQVGGPLPLTFDTFRSNKIKWFGGMRSSGSRQKRRFHGRRERDSSLAGSPTEFSPSPTITSRTLDKGYGFHRRLSLRDRATRSRSACRSSSVSRIDEKRMNGRWYWRSRNKRSANGYAYINAYIII